MKKRIFTISFLLVFLTGLLWAQFYTTLRLSERKQLAEAYYLVGKQYEKVGKANKAQEFRAMAFNIYPDLEPQNIKIKEYPTAQQLIAKYSFTVTIPQREGNVKEIIKSKFIRLISNLIAEDSASIIKLLDGSIYIDKINTEVTRVEAKEALNSLFSKINLFGLPPSKVFDTNSVKIYRADSQISQTWGVTYILEIKAIKDFSKYIGFWEENQKYYFHKRNNRWLIYSIGTNPPPYTWQPKQPVGIRPSYIPEEKTDAYSIKNSIKDNFLQCVEYFLKKDLQGATSYISKRILILRLRSTITREELQSTFKGYFENTDFSGITVEKLINTKSIFITKSDRFKDNIEGEVYVLTVKTNIDISDKIPFWTRYQEYFFKSEDGKWKIFAIF